MRIKALVYSRTVTNSISNFYLSDIPTTFSNTITLTPTNDKFKVLQTIFIKRYEGAFYEVEQIIAEFN